MIGRGSAVQSDRTVVRATAAACVAGAALSLVAGGVAARPVTGEALAVGLLIGSVNGGLAARSLGTDMDFRFASMGRLACLTAAGLMVGVLLGAAYVPLVVAGIAAAQMLLAVIAGFATWRGWA
ncbi:MAG: hypothetical protein ACREPA_01160 [Candidatus Dormibacteraceae bacterium]